MATTANGIVLLLAGTSKGDTTYLISRIITQLNEVAGVMGSEQVFETREPNVCSNQVCEETETFENCPQDCKKVASVLIPGQLDRTTFYDISPEYLVYDTEGKSQKKINVYSLSTNKLFTVTDKGSRPSSDGNHIAFYRFENNREQIVLYDIISKSESVISSETDARRSGPLLRNGNVYFVEREYRWAPQSSTAPVPKLFQYNIAGSKLTEVSSFEEGSIPEDGTDSILVYSAPDTCSPAFCIQHKVETSLDSFEIQNAVTGNLRVWKLDLKSKERSIFPPTTQYGEKQISVDKNLATWTSCRDPECLSQRVALFDGKQSFLVPGIKKQVSSDISSNVVVWTDYRNGNEDIYAYNLDTHTLQRLTNSKDHEGGPRINGKNVVFTRNGKIYLITI